MSRRRPPHRVLSEPLRQAYASTAPADLGRRKSTHPPPRCARRMPRRRSPRPSPSRQPQKNYALLSDVQIAGIKDRLKLSPRRNPTGRRWRPRCAPSPARFTQSGRPIPMRRHSDRSRGRRSPAVEIGGDAAAVPVARRPEERSALARPHHRAGKSRRDDLSDCGGARAAGSIPFPHFPVSEHRPQSTRCPRG
jgi:hypothetical protein